MWQRKVDGWYSSCGVSALSVRQYLLPVPEMIGNIVNTLFSLFEHNSTATYSTESSLAAASAALIIEVSASLSQTSTVI